MAARFKISQFTLWLTVLMSLCDCNESEPMVTVKQGQLKGDMLPLLDGGMYYSFKGIPYAHVPARFLAPEPPRPWQGTHDATKHGPKCPQYNMLVEQYIPGNENCLFLNVYTKTIKPNAKLPVMVFVHGGSYMFGAGDSDGAFGPEFLLQHDVILVTINYRLEVLGFLSLDTPEVPGNAGMKDQVAALRWVKNNIAQFGGDPESVTLFGESSGSSAVALHLQSSMSRGLFNKAITQSGVSIADWATGKDAKERAFRAAKVLGNDTRDTAAVIEFLRSVPVAKLANLTFKTMTKYEELRDLPIHFAPVVEKKFDNVEAFITDEPLFSLTAGKLSQVPLMIGYNSDESLLMLDDAFKKLNFTNKNLQYLVPREIAKDVPEEKTQKIGESIRNFYIGKREFNKDDAKKISDMLSDRHFVYNTHRFAHFYSKGANTYLYQFSCDTELNVVKTDIGLSHMTGASHADELFYIFYNNWNEEAYNKNPELKDIVYRVTKLWTDFAKYGNPTPNNSSGVTWPSYTNSNKAYMNIDKKFSVGRKANSARVNFWNEMYCSAGVACIAK